MIGSKLMVLQSSIRSFRIYPIFTPCIFSIIQNGSFGLEPRRRRLLALVSSRASNTKSVGECTEFMLILDIEPVIKLTLERFMKLLTDWFKLEKLVWLFSWLDWLDVWPLLLPVLRKLPSDRLSSSVGRHVSTIASRQSTNNSTFSGFSLATFAEYG